MSWIKDCIEAIQLKARYLFGAWLLGALILALPETGASFFGIAVFRTEYRGVIGIITLFAFAFWIVQLIPSYQSHKTSKKYKAQVLESLDALGLEERQLLIYCLVKNQKTISLEVTHRAATALVSKGIFIMAGVVGNQLAWPYNIPDFVWGYLKKNPQIAFKDIQPNDPRVLSVVSEIDRHIRRHDWI